MCLEGIRVEEYGREEERGGREIRRRREEGSKECLFRRRVNRGRDKKERELLGFSLPLLEVGRLGVGRACLLKGQRRQVTESPAEF